MTTKPAYALSDRDKTPNASGWGYRFHHTEPQRYVSCAKGDMLAPRSADDIAPITPEAMASVQAAIALLANLVGDRDHNLFLGNADHDGSMTAKARDIAFVAESLAGILRVEPVLTAEEQCGLAFARGVVDDKTLHPFRDVALRALDKLLAHDEAAAAERLP